jgi:hypothetical protein
MITASPQDQSAFMPVSISPVALATVTIVAARAVRRRLARGLDAAFR